MLRFHEKIHKYLSMHCNFTSFLIKVKCCKFILRKWTKKPQYWQCVWGESIKKFRWIRVFRLSPLACHRLGPKLIQENVSKNKHHQKVSTQLLTFLQPFLHVKFALNKYVPRYKGPECPLNLEYLLNSREIIQDEKMEALHPLFFVHTTCIIFATLFFCEAGKRFEIRKENDRNIL